MITWQSYIGLSQCPEKRFISHLNKPNNKHLRESINEYGKDNFELSILVTGIKNKDYGHLLEGKLMLIHNTMYPSGFNINGSMAIRRKKALEFKEKVMPYLLKIKHPFISLHRATNIRQSRISLAFSPYCGCLFTEKEQELICNYLGIEFVPITISI